MTDEERPGMTAFGETGPGGPARPAGGPGLAAPPRRAPWPLSAVTGLGPFPGTDPFEAARIVFCEVGALPFLAQLPARGPGADPVGRTAVLLADLHVDLQPAGWRLVPRPGHDERRARRLLADDLDALAEAGDGHHGPLVVTAVGPLTLAASLELPRGGRAVADAGALADLAGALGEGLVAHLGEIRRALPGTGRAVVVLDEPLGARVVRGELPTQSGWGRVRAVPAPEAADLLASVIAAARAGGAAVDVGVNPGGDPLAARLLGRAGAAFVGVAADAPLDGDDLGEVLDAGAGLLVALPDGPGAPGGRAALAAAMRRLGQLRERLSLDAAALAPVVALAPGAGFAALAPSDAAAALRAAVEARRRLDEGDTTPGFTPAPRMSAGA